jgi:hypothetical protein
VENKEQLAELTIYKEGQVLTGADVSENGTVLSGKLNAASSVTLKQVFYSA